jgi:dipeptidyl aminopeptidase/acylaminoacyl peptidase
VQDVYVVDLFTGTRIRLLEKIRGPVSLSPAAKYVAYYDFRKRHWFAVNAATLRVVQVTKDITVPLYDELDDHPDDPGPHGQAGWTGGDRRFLIYDRYDLWSTDPSGKEPAVNVTAGSGRKATTRFRTLRLDPEERFWKEDAPVLVRTFREKDKQTGYAFASVGVPASPTQLIDGPYQFGTPQKARKDSTMIFTRGNFQEFPDLFASDPGFGSPRRISTANAQQAEYLWGSVELISWKPADGKPLEGLLFKPAQFDPRKKYPMIVYYYERDSELLHQHRPPTPSRSTVNPSFYASRGYVVFIPDIRYRVGHPGKSAMDAIISGTNAVLARGFVDKQRMGLQGQSWGGYQTAYLVTQTPMFRAAMAGAPVANMTSAYGGIRWESGWSRAWQYEKAQSRIGGTLWDATPLYIENSPLFFAPKVATPLLIMHNDADGAVPWYQGIELFSALRRLNKPVWMLTYNNEEHNLTKWKNRKDLSVRLAQFFDHYLKGEPMPEWMAKGRNALDKQKTMSTGLVR